MENQIIDLIATDGIWALLFVFLLFYVLNVISKKIDAIATVLEENTDMLKELLITKDKIENRALK